MVILNRNVDGCLDGRFEEARIVQQQAPQYEDKRRFSRVTLHVQDLTAAIDHYEGLLGLRLLRVEGGAGGEPEVAIMGVGPEESCFCVALQPLREPRQRLCLGSGVGGLTLAVEDLEEKLARHRKAGLDHLILDELYANVPVVGTYGSQDRVGRVADLDGYNWELYELAPQHRSGAAMDNAICKLQLFVRDLNAALPFYTRVLGCNVLHQYVSADLKVKIAVVGYGEEFESTVLELREKEGGLRLGNGLTDVVIATSDVLGASGCMSHAGSAPQPVLEAQPPTVALHDPDGWRYVLVEQAAVEREQ